MRFDSKAFTSLDDEYYIAFSGGKDSLAIAHHLSKVKNKEIRGLLHFNHGLSPDARIEAQCIDAAEQLGLPIIVGRTREKPSGSIEAWCRDKRYEWLNTFAGDIVVCHHLQDVVEQYLMNCLKGQGEYLPFAWKTLWKNVRIVRPYLAAKQSDIISYLSKSNLDCLVAEDPYNHNLDLTRNKIRSMMKTLEGYGLEKVVLKKFYLS